LLNEMGRKLELTGKVFGRLSVLRESENRSNQKVIQWWVQCSCGSDPFEIIGSKLMNGHTKSCGCIRKERGKKVKTTHGESQEGCEYKAWSNMKARCYNKNNKAFKDYGGRGIKVCDRWLESFENFLVDLGRKPTKKNSIDRIENNGDYEPDNCRWADRRTQNMNRRNSKNITLDGVTKPLIDWLKEFGLSRGGFMGRINKGWSTEKALKTPVRSKTS